MPQRQMILMDAIGKPRQHCDSIATGQDMHSTREAKKIRVVDLFCGSGGMSRGLLDAGIDVVAAYDIWSACVNTYRRNISEHAYVLDLSNVDQAIQEIQPIAADMIVGGPPCQDFSTAGKRIEAGRASLTTDFAQIIKACRPQFLLMENVPQARNSRAYGMMKNILSDYHFQEIVLDASRCGVPQARKRFFSFGSLEGNTAFIEWIAGNIASDRLTIKEYLQGEIDIEFYYRHPRNYSRRGVFSVYEPSPTIRGVNRPVPPGYKQNHLDSASPQSVRPLTTMERSRLQTFARTWDWRASDRNADAETQIGNAVPPNLAQFVGRGILNAVA